MTDLHLTSTSRAEDASYQALADSAQAAGRDPGWRILGGHMVNLHATLAGVRLPLRATRDADLAVEVLAIRDGGLLERLRSLGYDNSRSGNRFEKGTGTTAVATIDLLVPSYTSSHVPNLDAGPIAVDGIPALHVALARPPVSVTLHVATSTGAELTTTVQLPELPAAIAVKTFAYVSRRAPRDAQDLHRLLESAFLTGVEWPSGSTFREASDALTRHFDSPGHGLRNVASDTATRTRMRALVRTLSIPPS
jgi:hypothetical protein